MVVTDEDKISRSQRIIDNPRTSPIDRKRAERIIEMIKKRNNV